ncbi:MAG TPA: LAGLIDADG family homing endonuclease [archaeon]|nr:LAGLIDADG family homing endonuclease [archaeon]
MNVKNLAYIAGLIIADGHIRRDYGILIYIKDKQFREKVKNKLTKFTKNKISDKYRNGVNEVYFTDKSFATLIMQKFKIPMGNKAAKIELSSNLTSFEKIHLIEGYFDGDGSIYPRKMRTSSGNLGVYWELKFKSKSIRFLRQCKVFIKSQQIKSSDIRRYMGQVPYFVISRREDIARFYKIFKPIRKLGPSTRWG